MAAVRAAVGPTSVQDPQHPLCLACGRSHRAAAFIPLPVRRSSPPRRSTSTRSRLLLDLGILSVLPSLAAQRRPYSGKATGPSRPDRDMKATRRRIVNGLGAYFSALSHPFPRRRRRRGSSSRKSGYREPSWGQGVQSGFGVSAGLLRVDSIPGPAPLRGRMVCRQGRIDRARTLVASRSNQEEAFQCANA